MSSDEQVVDPKQPGPADGIPVEPQGRRDQPHASLFNYVPHPRIHRRKQEGPVKIADQLDRTSPIARLNTRVALLITVGVGSMWAAYLFTLLALVSFPSAIGTRNSIIIVAWIAQTFLQLVLLPVIIVGQNIQGAAADKRAEQTYNDAEAILHEALQIQEHLAAQDVELRRQEQTLQAIIAALRQAYPAAGQSTLGATD